MAQPIGVFCPACDRQGITSDMIKDTSTPAEGMVVRCLVANHRYNYDRLLQANPRKRQLALQEKRPAQAMDLTVWIYPEALEALRRRFPQNLQTTLCATLTALADSDTVLVEGEHARAMRELGVERGRDVLGLARQVKSLTDQMAEMRIREKALEPLLKLLGGQAGAGTLAAQTSPLPTATVGGQRNPDLPAAAMAERLIENEEGLLVPEGEWAGAGQAGFVDPAAATATAEPQYRGIPKPVPSGR